MMKKFGILFLFLTISIIADLAVAQELKVQRNDSIRFPQWGVAFCRPSDRWRIVPSSSALQELRYNRHGGNVSVFFREGSLRNYQKRQLRKSFAGQKLLRDFLQPYESRGFKFYQYEIKDDVIRARGTNVEREILFLESLPVRDGRFVTQLVLEMQIPRDLYTEFHPEFEAIAASFSRSDDPVCLF